MKAGPLAHLPSGTFNANGAWLALAVITHNLMRAAGTLASKFHAKATCATLRDHLVKIPARLASSARRIAMHLPAGWRWQADYEHLHAAVFAPPGHAA